MANETSLRALKKRVCWPSGGLHRKRLRPWEWPRKRVGDQSGPIDGVNRGAFTVASGMQLADGPRPAGAIRFGARGLDRNPFPAVPEGRMPLVQMAGDPVARGQCPIAQPARWLHGARWERHERRWDERHADPARDPERNPYRELPQMQMFTYALSEVASTAIDQGAVSWPDAGSAGTARSAR